MANNIAVLTNPLDKKFGSKRSLMFVLLAKSTSVFITDFAFDENHNVSTITNPAINSKKVGVGTLVPKKSIANSVAGTPEAAQA